LGGQIQITYARDLFETLCDVNDEILMYKGFWVVEDTSFVGNIKNHSNMNLECLLRKSSKCYLKFDVQSFEASFLASEEVNYDTNLYDFIVYSLMVERSIEDLRVRFVEGGSSLYVFHEALFYYMPNTCNILYG